MFAFIPGLAPFFLASAGAFGLSAVPRTPTGVRVGVTDVDGDGLAELLTATGPGAGPHVKVFGGSTLAELDSVTPKHPVLIMQGFNGPTVTNSLGRAFFAGLTPFPFKVITIASGVTGLNLVSFVAASIAARGMRFFLVCGLIYWFGPPVRGFIERHLGLMTLLFGVLLVGGFVVAGYLL